MSGADTGTTAAPLATPRPRTRATRARPDPPPADTPRDGSFAGASATCGVVSRTAGVGVVTDGRPADGAGADGDGAAPRPAVEPLSAGDAVDDGGVTAGEVSSMDFRSTAAERRSVRGSSPGTPTSANVAVTASRTTAAASAKSGRSDRSGRRGAAGATAGSAAEGRRHSARVRAAQSEQMPCENSMPHPLHVIPRILL